jgi:hypothetical protein
LQQADWRGFEKALNGVWDDIKQVFALLADLQANSEKLLEYLSEAELEALLNASSDAIANGLLILSDEPLLFIHLAAFTSWLKMLPPQYLAEVVAEVRAELLISFLLMGLSGGVGVPAALEQQGAGEDQVAPRAGMAGGVGVALGRTDVLGGFDAACQRFEAADAQCA